MEVKINAIEGCLQQRESKHMNIHNELKAIIDNLYHPLGIDIDQIKTEADPKGKQYGACTFTLNDKLVVYRVAKTTQDRPGQFVTLWKRPHPTDKITPFELKDNIQFVIVNVDGIDLSNNKYCGQFIFPTEILIAKGILSSKNKKGKLAIRVFPPWSELISNEGIEQNNKSSTKSRKTQMMSTSAKKTQQWQLQYFLPTNINGTTGDIKLLERLLKRNC